MYSENNIAEICGKIVRNFEYGHRIAGEGFYESVIESERKSGTFDNIPIVVSERLVDVKDNWENAKVKIVGCFQSINKQKDSKKVILYFFVKEFLPCTEEISDKNIVNMDGYICKEPNYRLTPLGREICDILIAVNRPYGKADYIPCICWGRNARFAYRLKVGTHLRISGRIQSREYTKKLSETEAETRTAYEVSISKLEVTESEEREDQVSDAE